jgi:hypothetical protein
VQQLNYFGTAQKGLDKGTGGAIKFPLSCPLQGIDERGTMGDTKVIDADGHVIDRDTDIRPHMDEPYCRRKGSLLFQDEWDASITASSALRPMTSLPASRTWIKVD